MPNPMLFLALVLLTLISQPQVQSDGWSLIATALADDDDDDALLSCAAEAATLFGGRASFYHPLDARPCASRARCRTRARKW